MPQEVLSTINKALKWAIVAFAVWWIIADPGQAVHLPAAAVGGIIHFLRTV
jgi:hypothetical protein